MGHTGVIVDVVLGLVVILLIISCSTEGTDVHSGNGNNLYSMYYITLHSITLHFMYIILHCIAFYVHYIALHCIALHCIALH